MDEQRRLLAERYEIRELIGRGGMAQVHLGFDTRLSRLVAIKILRSDLARDGVFQERFRREAQAAAALNHPAIVAVYDTGEDIKQLDGQLVHIPYIVMEYVQGHTVRELLTGGDPVPINEAVEIVSGVLSALEYSHAANLVHRDIKPGNVMITTAGKVKVMDFGIARALTDSAATMTQTDAVVGTAQYLSPEQARGEQVDTRSDLYSTGCLLFELLTGRPPFQGDSAVAVAYQHVSELPVVPSSLARDIPEALDRVVLKALAKDKVKRYATAAQMHADLLAAYRGQQVQAPAASAWRPVTAAAAGAGAGLGAGMAMAGAGPASAQPTAVMGAAGPSMPPPPPPHMAATGVMPGVGMAAAGHMPGGNPPTPPGIPGMGMNTIGPAGQAAKKKGIPAWVWAVVAVVVLAIGGGTAWILSSSGETTPEVVKVKVPADLAGKSQAEVRQALTNVGLTMKLGEPEHSDTIPEGQFVSSDPAPGTEVEKGSKVTVRLSGGPDSFALPDYSGQNKDTVAAELRDKYHLDVETTSEDTGSVEKNRVIRTEPAPDEMLKAGDKITVIFASGNVSVPDSLTGKTKDEVVSFLVANGLNPNTVQEEDGSYPPDTVLRIDKAGTVVPRGSKVTIVVAKAPPVTPTVTPTPEPTTDAPTPTPTPTPSSS